MVVRPHSNISEDTQVLQPALDLPWLHRWGSATSEQPSAASRWGLGGTSEHTRTDASVTGTNNVYFTIITADGKCFCP